MIPLILFWVFLLGAGLIGGMAVARKFRQYSIKRKVLLVFSFIVCILLAAVARGA
ncbi:hypothetical protein ES703_53432 [subsurface metagenome]